MHLDAFTTTAQALLAAAGKADTLLVASMTRRGATSEYYLYAQADVAGLPWPETLASATEPTAEAALAAFAKRLNTTYPLPAVVYATQQQKEDLQRLYNHPTVKPWEKSKMLLNINRYTEAQAEQMLADGPLSFRQELRRREAAERGVAVSGEVFTVAPAQAA